MYVEETYGPLREQWAGDGKLNSCWSGLILMCTHYGEGHK